MEEGDPLHNMQWWDQITWDELLEHTGATMVHVPRPLTFAVGQWRARVSRHILAQEDAAEQRRGWKLFLALDLLLFGDLRDEKAQQTKTRTIADRMEAMNAGHWDSVWSAIGQRQPGTTGGGEEIGNTVKRVRALMQVKELSRAATAV